jgi:hypothetical protein
MVKTLVETDPRQKTSQVEQILVILAKLSEQTNEEWIDSLLIEKEALGKYGLRLHWRTIDSILKNNKVYAARKKRGKCWMYRLLEKGRLLVSDEKKAILIEPSNSIQSMIDLQKYLSGLSGNIYICDPYIDHVSLDILSSCPSSSSLFVLSRNVKIDGKFKSLLPSFTTAGFKIEVRIAPNPILHDRYIIDDAEMIILGTSLNGFGKKQSFLIKVGTDIKQTMLIKFKELWSQSKILQI